MHRLLAALIIIATAFAQEAPVSSLDVDKLILDFDNTIRAHTQKLIAAKTDAERAALSSQFPAPDKLAPTMARVMREHPDALMQKKAMSWLVARVSNLPEGQEALKQLQDNFAVEKGLGEVIDFLSHSSPAIAEPVLREIREKNPNTEEKAASTYGLGLIAFGKSEAGDKAALADATTLLTETVTTYKDVTVNGFKLSDQAAALLFEIENLQVGKPAPDIEGKDVTGASFKLSDYRGKVAVVVFWGAWCHACHASFDLIKAGVASQGDKVVLLGVNTDPLEKIKEITQTENITWRNWCDEFNRGPISALWNIRHWPTIYVIDGTGIIRGKDVAPGALQVVLGELVK
jgi:peroxiredoxin